MITGVPGAGVPGAGPAGKIGQEAEAGQAGAGNLFAMLLALLDRPLSGEAAGGGTIGFGAAMPEPGAKAAAPEPSSIPEADASDLVAELLSALEALVTSLDGGQPVPEPLVEAATQALAAASLGIDAETMAPGALSGTLIGELTALLSELRRGPAGAFAGASAGASVGASGGVDDNPKTEPAPANRNRLGAELARLADGLGEEQPELAQRLAELGRQFRHAADRELAPPAAGGGPRLAASVALEAELPPALGGRELSAPQPSATPAGGPEADRPGLTAAAVTRAAAPQAAQNKAAQNQTAPPPSLAQMAADPEPGAPQFVVQQGAAKAISEPAAAGRPTTVVYGQPQINLPAVAFEIARQFNAGVNRFQVRLDPPELGRIEVRLDIDGGKVNARLSVERPETLELMQRDARALERALAQAGLDTGRSGLEFTLKQNPFGGGRDGANGGEDTRLPLRAAEAEPAGPADPGIVQLYYRGTAGPGGVNLLV